MLPLDEPAKGLPDWVVAVFKAKQPAYFAYLDPKISGLAHRAEAFFRLFSSADKDMLEMWSRVPEYHEFKSSKPARFVDCLILATDSTMAAPLRSVPPGESESLPRVRTKAQRLARKLGVLLSELQLTLPTTTIDGQVNNHNPWFGVEREFISREFGVDIHHVDLGEMQKAYGITCGSDSKKGYTQHRRAADIICAKAQRVALSLHSDWPADWLLSLIHALESLPLFEDEKADQPLLFSQKASWADWVTQASLMLSESYEKPFLRLKDWQILVGLLFDTWPDLQIISEVLKRSGTGINQK